jgi:hypothetical protein
MPRTPAIQRFIDWNARAERLRIEATGRELARLAELGPDAYHAATEAEEPQDAAEAKYYATN